MWISQAVKRMKRLAAILIATVFLIPACENVWAIPFWHPPSTPTQGFRSSPEMTATDSGTPDHLICGNHSPKSPCDNSEPQHFEIALPSSESTKSSDKGYSCKPIVFSSDFQRLSVDREPKISDTPYLRVRWYADLVGIVKRLD